jgi:hypothetical protein
MKRIFICYPYADNPDANIVVVRKICLAIKDKYVPIAPHLFLPQYISEEKERPLAIKHCKRLIECCDEVWICSKRITQGMVDEIRYAKDLGITVINMEGVT